MVQDYSIKLTGCQWQGVTKPWVESKGKSNCFKHKDAVSDWENPLAAETRCMQEKLLRFATRLETPISWSYVLLSSWSTNANTRQPALPWAGAQSACWPCGWPELVQTRKHTVNQRYICRCLRWTSHRLPASSASEDGLGGLLQPPQISALLENRC